MLITPLDPDELAGYNVAVTMMIPKANSAGVGKLMYNPTVNDAAYIFAFVRAKLSNLPNRLFDAVCHCFSFSSTEEPFLSSSLTLR